MLVGNIASQYILYQTMEIGMKQLKVFCTIALVIVAMAMPLMCVSAGYAEATHPEVTAEPAAEAHGGHDIGTELPLWSVLPFAGILLSIALFPLFAPHFWHHHFPKVSAFWALVFAIPFVIYYKGIAAHEILHIYIIDYIPFIILLWALFTISGGILVKGTLKGTPIINSVILLIGSLIASWIGTTGASMLLIRPILRSNAWRKHKVHTIVFFIFLVSNIGGSLTPLGDPPLFLGFLHGVPFFWTLTHLFTVWVFAVAILLGLYFVIDSYFYSKEDKSKEDYGQKQALKVEGWHNFIFLAGVVGGVLFSGLVKLGEVNILGVHQAIENLIRDAVLIIMGLLSLKTTSQQIRKDNEFSWFPIQEVAYLFAGIFMTIIPALAILKAGEHGALAFLINAVKQPAHYFWATGVLSSFLDNAPTYLTFFNTALGSFFAGMPEIEAVHRLIAEQNVYLQAIAASAVFMGANTYIGNAPNFMVKSISEEAGIRMPSFFGYMFKYSIPILIPVFILVTYVFFR
jgi:Na+/H+ antiporter NhaD/arsenite permease-like protein